MGSSAPPLSTGCSITTSCSRTFTMRCFREDGWRHNAAADRIWRVFEREPTRWRRRRSLPRTSPAFASPGSLRMRKLQHQRSNEQDLLKWKRLSNPRRRCWRTADQYGEFVPNIIFRRHLEALPTEELRAEFIEKLTEQAAADDPPFLLDYWRLNLRGRAA